jgi:hypothetical protein
MLWSTDTTRRWQTFFLGITGLLDEVIVDHFPLVTAGSEHPIHAMTKLVYLWSREKLVTTLLDNTGLFLKTDITLVCGVAQLTE